MPQQSNKVTLRNYPFAAGLAHAGPQALSNESSFWEAQNASSDFAGRVEKRKGLRQWGQRLKEPTNNGTTASNLTGLQYIEVFNDLSDFNVDKSSAGTTVEQELRGGQLRMKTTGTSAGTNLINVERLTQTSDGTKDATSAHSVRFMFRAIGTLPANPGSGNDYGPSVVISDGSSREFSFAFFSTGIHYKDSGTGLYTLIASTDVDDNIWHIIEIRISDSLTAVVNIDDGTDSAATLTMEDVGVTVSLNLAGPNQIMFRARTNGLITYEVRFDFVQGRSNNTTTSFVGTAMRQSLDWRSFNPIIRHLIIVSGKTVYRDTNHTGIFFALDTVPASKNVLLTTFQDELIILTSGQAMRRWTGSGAPTEIRGTLGNAPNGVVGVEHLSRLFVIDAQDPLRVHFSGVSDLDDWTTTEIVGTDGGNFLIPNRTGERVNGMLGNYYGRLLIGTNTSFHQVVGTIFTGVNSNFVVQTLSESLGVVGPRAITLAGADVQFVSQQGVHSLLRTEKFGDIETEFLSTSIRLRWAGDSQFGLRNVLPNYDTVLAYHPELHRTYLAVAVEGDATIERVFEFNNTRQFWTGPNDYTSAGMNYARLSTLAFTTMIVGDSSGRIAHNSYDIRSDFGSGYSFRLRSARIDGRSLARELSGMGKTWYTLRVFVQPRGEWNIKLSWETDECRYVIDDTTGDSVAPFANLTQNPDKAADLDSGTSTTPTGDGATVLDAFSLLDSEKVVVLTYQLDMPGRWLQFTLEQSNDSEDASILGWHLDFLPNKVLQEESV